MGHVVFHSMSVGVKGLWSKEAQTYMLKNCKAMFIEDIAECLGKTVKACKSKAFRMGCSIQSKGNT